MSLATLFFCSSFLAAVCPSPIDLIISGVFAIQQFDQKIEPFILPFSVSIIFVTELVIDSILVKSIGNTISVFGFAR